MAESWLRIITYDLPDDQAIGADYVRSSLGDVIEVLKGQPGFRGGYWGDSVTDRTVAAVMHWNGLTAIEDAAEALQDLRAQRKAAGLSVANVQNVRLSAIFGDPRRPMAVPFSGLVEGHPHGGKRRADNQTESRTRMRVVLSRVRDRGGPLPLEFLRTRASRTKEVFQAQPGFLLGYLGDNPSTDTFAAVSYWLNQDALARAEPALDRLAQQRHGHEFETISARTFHLFPMPVGAVPLAPITVGAR